MRLASVALAVLIAGALATSLSRCSKDPPPSVAPAAVDERVALLFEPSMARGPYDVDLANVTPILIETLRVGSHESLPRAKMELAADGARGVDAIRRYIERYRDDPGGVDYLRNAVDVLSLSADPAAAPLLWSLLAHPSESLRIQVLRALLVHPLKESFEPALGVLANAPESYQEEVCASLAKLDPERAQTLWLSWIESGDNPSLWPTILPYLGTIREPALLERVRALLKRDNLELAARLWLCASAAHGGDVSKDDAALAQLRTSRESKNPTERDLAVRALAAAERYDELGWTLAHDEYPQIRALVVRAALPQIGREEARELLQQAANDPDDTVSRPALTALANSGGGQAVDEAFQWLASSTLAEVEAGIQILRERMHADPALAQRVFELLLPRLEAMQARPTVEQAMFLKILGQIPLRAATLRLIDLARTTRGAMESTRAQRFILRQSVNAGIVAQDELAQLWRTSDDAVLRMDAIEAFSALGGDHSRELLIEVLDDPRATPQELVFVADRLVRIGPAKEVAWQLKRAAARIEDARAREALQGILWRWYPPPAAAK